MLASDILDAAANRIEKYGWFKMSNKPDRMYDRFPTKGHINEETECAYTALRSIIRTNPDGMLVYDFLAETIDPKYQKGNPSDTIFAWNDAQPNASNVIRKLRAVAKKLRARGE